MSAFGGDGAKSTWVTRRVPTDLPVTWGPLRNPAVGDLLLCEVVTIGLHGRAETTTGGRAKLYAGDRIVCAVGNRYATSMLEAVAEVGDDHVDMVSASGLCGRVVTRSKRASTPTALRPLGQAFLDDQPVNLRSFALGAPEPALGDPRWVVVVGSAMDSGKTTACTSIIRGLIGAGNRVGAAKLTGTASGRDFGSFRDAGASPVLDFLDAGWPSTVGCTVPELAEVLHGLTGHLRAAGVEWGVLEIADGLLQAETGLLLESLSAQLGGVDLVVTTREGLAAVACVDLLARLGLELTAVSGLVTNSPLACREVELACSVPCVPTPELGRWLARRDRRTTPAVESAPVGIGMG